MGRSEFLALWVLSSCLAKEPRDFTPFSSYLLMYDVWLFDLSQSIYCYDGLRNVGNFCFLTYKLTIILIII